MKRLLAIAICGVFLLLAIRTPVLAQTTACEITLDKITATNVHFCVGGFSSAQELGDAVLSANIFGTNGQRVRDLAPQFTAANSSSGYYTCFGADVQPEYRTKDITMTANYASKYFCSVSFNPTNDAGRIISSASGEQNQFNICQGITDADQISKCNSCLMQNAVWTGLGCINFDPASFIEKFLNIALGVAGGIAFILIIYGAFLISTSAGDPKRADEGKDVINGTIAGLIFIVFSVVLLRFIGVDILHIPGF